MKKKLLLELRRPFEVKFIHTSIQDLKELYGIEKGENFFERLKEEFEKELFNKIDEKGKPHNK